MMGAGEIALGDNRAADLRELVDDYANAASALADEQGGLKDRLAKAKDSGFDVDALKDVLKERAMDGDKLVKLHRREHARSAYRKALGLPGSYDEAAAQYGDDE